MTITQLKCFQAVCKYKKFSTAAEQLYISQSSVSKHIIALEAELGLELLERKGRSFEVTEEGNILLRYFSTILSTYDQVVEVADELKEKKRKEKISIHIIGTPGMHRYGFLDILRDFNKTEPEIKISLEDMEGLSALSTLEYGSCDFAFLSCNELDPSSFSWIDISEDSIAVAVRKDNPISEKHLLEPDDLKGYELILPGRITLMYEICRQYFKDIEKDTEIIRTTSRPEIGLEYLKDGHKNIFFWPSRFLYEYKYGDYQVCQLENAPKVHYLLAWRKDQSLTIPQKKLITYFSDVVGGKFMP